MDLPGIEPGTPVCKTGILPLDYEPLKLFSNSPTEIGRFEMSILTRSGF